MSFAGRRHVDQLTPENSSESKRMRRMGRISMSAWLEEVGDGRYRGVYGDPNGFGTEVFFDGDPAGARGSRHRFQSKPQ